MSFFDDFFDGFYSDFFTIDSPDSATPETFVLTATGGMGINYIDLGWTQALSGASGGYLVEWIIDISGSMSTLMGNGQTRMENVKTALRAAVTELLADSNNLTGIVWFSDSAYSVVEPTNNLTDVLAAIDTLVPTFGTDIESGIVLGRTKIEADSSDRLKILAVLSDGVGGNPIPAAQDFKADNPDAYILGMGVYDDPDDIGSTTMEGIGIDGYFFCNDADDILNAMDTIVHLGQPNRYRIFRRERDVPLSPWELVNDIPSQEVNTYRDYNVGNDVYYDYYVIAYDFDQNEDNALGKSNIAFTILIPEGFLTMLSRATVYQSIQTGTETTAGVIVPTTRKLMNMSITPTPGIPLKVNKYPGSKVAQSTQIGQEDTAFTYEGVIDFNTIAHIFDSMFGQAAPTLVRVGGTAYTRSWNPSPVEPITPKTYTFEHGSGGGAEKFGYGIFADLTMKFNREEASISGSGFGQKTIRDITPTASVLEIPTVACQPVAFGVYRSADGTTFTRLTDDMDAEFRFGGLWAPTFHVNDLNPSFDKVHELMPDFGGTFSMEEGTEVSDMMSNLRQGDKIFVGFKVLGPLIDAAITGGSPSPAIYHAITCYVPCYITTQAPGDNNGVWGNAMGFEIAHDTAYGMAKITVVNKLATI